MVIVLRILSDPSVRVGLPNKLNSGFPIFVQTVRLLLPALTCTNFTHCVHLYSVWCSEEVPLCDPLWFTVKSINIYLLYFPFLYFYIYRTNRLYNLSAFLL
jgi:hypothetical protein